MPPDQAQTLRSGQHSFAMFGHPYEWVGSGVSWKKVTLSALTDNEGVETAPALVYASVGGLQGENSPDTSIPYRTWSRGVFVCDDAALLNPQRKLDEGTLAFVPNIAHTSTTVFDGSPGAADVPGSNRPFPTEARGQWFKPGTNPRDVWRDNQGNPLDMDTLDATGLKLRANSDWVPNSDTILSQITGGQAIRYRRGYPEFSDYAHTTAPLLYMTGDNATDFGVANDFFGAVQGRSWAVDWIENTLLPLPNSQTTFNPDGPNWVWHHHQDMRHMQLVPSPLNTPTYGGVSHRGGADWAKKARW